MELIVRRAFTFVQLRTILEENHHPFLIVEHRAYERARDMAGQVAQAMKQASKELPSSCTPGVGLAPRVKSLCSLLARQVLVRVPTDEISWEVSS